MKRFLSIILAIAMIAVMLPNVFAADTFEGDKYVFTKAAFESSGSVQRNTLANMTLETPKPSISDKRKVAGSNCLYNVYRPVTNPRPKHYKKAK